MCLGATRDRGSSNDDVSSSSFTREIQEEGPSYRPALLFGFGLFIFALTTLLFMTPIIPGLQEKENGPFKDPETYFIYPMSQTLYDLALLSATSIFLTLVALYKAYQSPTLHLLKTNPYPHIEPNHTNGMPKTRDEKEEEALEEPMRLKLARWCRRWSSPVECLCLIQGVMIIFKCLARLNMEIAVLNEANPHHVMFWLTLLLNGIQCVVLSGWIQHVSIRMSSIGEYKRKKHQRERQVVDRHHLMEPLIVEGGMTTTADEEEQSTNLQTEESSPLGTNTPVVSDITGDSHYKACFYDFVSICHPDRLYFISAFFFLILAASAQVLIPKYMGNMLDSLANYTPTKDGAGHDSTDIWNIPGFMCNMKYLCLACILGGIFSGCRSCILFIVGGRVNVRLRSMLMDSLLSQDIGFFDITKTGDITSRLSSDTAIVGNQLPDNLNIFLTCLFQAIGVLISMFLLSWQLTLLAFVSVPIITILSRLYGEFLRSSYKLMQKKLADGNSISEAALGSMATVRALGAEHIEIKDFADCMDQYLCLNRRLGHAILAVGTMYQALPQLVKAVILFYGGLLVINDGDEHMTSGKLVSFLLYLNTFSDSISGIGNVFASLSRAIGAADKVFELIHRKPKRTDASSPAPSQTENNSLVDTSKKIEKFRLSGDRPSDCRGEIAFDKVTMNYPSRPQRRILNELSLRVPPGTVAALVGPSGGGKSSIISLVQNLYETSSGSVTLDGKRLSDISPEWLTRQVAIVSQEPTLFARSIYRNIIYGLEGTEFEPSASEVKEAARLANASSFIESLPLQYETDVGERGVQLSGGQKQRIAIARALVRQPKILLLDEATSALDSESEAMVQEAIDNMITTGRSTDISSENSMSSSMTVIIVAHRMSTVRNADVIFVLEDGKVVEKGRHEDLLEIHNGCYAKLINKQMNVK